MAVIEAVHLEAKKIIIVIFKYISPQIKEASSKHVQSPR